MQFSFKTIKEKCQKLFPPSSPEEDRSIEDHTAQLEEQAKIDSVSDAYSTWLCDLWQILRKQTYHQFKVEDLELFGISYEKFELDTGVDLLPPDENTFFSPNFAKVKNLQPDPDQWGFEDIMDFLGEWPEPSKSPSYKEVKRDNAESLCSALYVAFASLEWKEYEKKESICLQHQTNWRHADFDEAFDVNKWRVSGFWHNRGCDNASGCLACNGQATYHGYNRPRLSKRQRLSSSRRNSSCHSTHDRSTRQQFRSRA